MGNTLEFCAGARDGDGAEAPAERLAVVKYGDESPTDDGLLYDVLDKRSDEVWVWRVGRCEAFWRSKAGLEYATMRLLDPRDLARYTGDTIDVLRTDIQLFDNMHAKSIFDAETWGSHLGIDPADIATPIGLQIDVLDIYRDSRGRKAQKWRKAEVVQTNKLCSCITVHYHGWSRHYDERINLLKDFHARIRKFGSESDLHPPIKIKPGSENEKSFLLQLTNNRRGQLKVHAVKGDGNCMFRSIAHQVWGDPDRHWEMRQMCCDYMERRGIGRELLGADTDERFTEYIANMRQDKVWGDDPEIRAMEEMLDIPIQVWNTELEDGGQEPSTIHLSGSFPPNKVADQTCDPIRLSYHGYSHYNSIILVAKPPPLMGEDYKACTTQDIYDWRRINS